MQYIQVNQHKKKMLHYKVKGICACFGEGMLPVLRNPGGQQEGLIPSCEAAVVFFLSFGNL